jgi:GTP pyrophosphokinase
MEIQIRTYEMHEEAEYGVAAHWHYASAKSAGASDEKLQAVFAPEEKLSWVKQLANWQKEVVDNQEFMRELKFDALSHRIFIFTPKGDVKDLPLGATPIDFAYCLHTELGDRTVGAKVNGKMVSLDSELKSGDVCEIILAKEPRRPNSDWLEFVATNLARREVQKGLRARI